MKHAILLLLLLVLPSCCNDWEEIAERRAKTIDSLRIAQRDAEERGIAIASSGPWAYEYDKFEAGEYAEYCRGTGHKWIGFPLEPICLWCGLQRRYVGAGNGWDYLDSLKAANGEQTNTEN